MRHVVDAAIAKTRVVIELQIPRIGIPLGIEEVSSLLPVQKTDMTTESTRGVVLPLPDVLAGTLTDDNIHKLTQSDG